MQIYPINELPFEFMRSNAIDFVLTVPNSLPAPPVGGMKAGWKACGYTFLWNIVSMH